MHISHSLTQSSVRSHNRRNNILFDSSHSTPFIVRFRAIVCWCFPLCTLYIFFNCFSPTLVCVCMCVCVSGWFVFWSSPVRRMSECMHGRLEGVNALSAEGNDRGVNLLNSLPASLYFRAPFNFALMEWHFATNSQEVHRLQRPKIIK